MLELYSNIRKLRKQLNMSQQELAEAVGYKGKSMIAQVESGKVNLPASMITKFAEVFQVSELELMGLDAPDQPDESKEFAELFESATPDIQQAVLTLLKSARHDS